VAFAYDMAPRPMLLVSATGDWTKNMPREEYPAIRSIYELYGQEDEMEVVQYQAPHNFNRQSRESVYAFLNKHLLGGDGQKKPEPAVTPEALLDMLLWQGRSLPANALSQQQIFEQWKAGGRKRMAALDTAARRQAMLDMFHAEWPANVLSQRNREAIVLSRPGRVDRVPGVWVDGNGPATLVVHPEDRMRRCVMRGSRSCAGRAARCCSSMCFRPGAPRRSAT
jgi:hypothetical protein